MLKSIRYDALKLVAWLVCSLIIGAALAPFLYHGCKALVQFRVLESMGAPGQWLEGKLDNAHFGRYFNRSMLIGALVCMYPLIRSLKLKKSHLGLQRNIHWKTDFGIGFVLASSILLIFGIIYVELGIFETQNSFSEKILLKFLISALAVAAIEEFLFRGLLMGAVMRTARPFYALIFVSFFFALIHFLKPPTNCARLADQDIHYFWTGFWTVGQIFAQFDNPVFIAKGFATLFAVGLVLGWARLRTSSLWLCMGLHAGWVFCVKIYDYHTLAPKKYGQDLILPYIGSDLKVGMIPFCGVFHTGAHASIWLVIRKNMVQLAQNKKLPTN